MCGPCGGWWTPATHTALHREIQLQLSLNYRVEVYLSLLTWSGAEHAASPLCGKSGFLQTWGGAADWVFGCSSEAADWVLGCYMVKQPT